MADKTLRETFSALADGIRSCLGEDESVHYTPAAMIEAIESLDVTSLYCGGIDGRCFWTENNHLTEMPMGTYYVYGDSTYGAEKLEVGQGLYKVDLGFLDAPTFTDVYDGTGWYFVDSNYNAAKGTTNNVVFYGDATGFYTRTRNNSATRLGGTNDLYWISNDGTYALSATPPQSPCYYGSSGEFTSYQLNDGSTYTYHQEPETTPYFVVASGGSLEDQYVYTSDAGEIINLTANGAAVIQGYAGDSAASVLADGSYVIQDGYATPGGSATLADQYVYTSDAGEVINLTEYGAAVIQGYAGDSAASVLSDGTYVIQDGYATPSESGGGDAPDVSEAGWYNYTVESGWYDSDPAPTHSIVALYDSGGWEPITTTGEVFQLAVNETLTVQATLGLVNYTFTITRNS